MNPAHDTFASVYAASDDPWGFRTYWYEARKRDILLSCLPARRYRNAYEPGCANGELAAALAPRCEQLLASDGVAAAVALARTRLAGFKHVQVAQHWIPEDWGSGVYDLIVISEMGFYLSAQALQHLVVRARGSLSADGTLVACHWRHAIHGYEMDGDTVHRRLNTQLGLPRLVHHEEADFVLDVWCLDARSVAQREGLAASP
jgi:SAM-dependent methyltransferase